MFCFQMSLCVVVGLYSLYVCNVGYELPVSVTVVLCVCLQWIIIFEIISGLVTCRGDYIVIWHGFT